MDRRKMSRQSRATLEAGDVMRQVIDSFRNETPFMTDKKSARTENREAAIATAPTDVQELLGQGFSTELVARIARMENE